MEKSMLYAELRSEVGTNASHRSRERGHIPAVLYGHNTPTKSLEVENGLMNHIINQYGSNALLEMNIDGHEHTALIKEIQRNPVTYELMHIDFQEVCKTEIIHTAVPIQLIGREKVESSASVVQQQIHELDIECLPDDIPNNISIDITSLSMGHPVKVSDVEFAGEISILNEPQEIIASLGKAERISNSEEAEETEGTEQTLESKED